MSFAGQLVGAPLGERDCPSRGAPPPRDRRRYQRDGEPFATSAQLLRARMAFLVDNLQYFLHVDVIEAAFAKLWSEMSDENMRDFDSLKRAHDECVARMISESFVGVGVVKNAVDAVLELCLRLCTVVQSVDRKESPRELSTIGRLYEQRSNVLFTLISAMAPPLRERLDSNRWFTRSALARSAHEPPVRS